MLPSRHVEINNLFTCRLETMLRSWHFQTYERSLFQKRLKWLACVQLGPFAWTHRHRGRRLCALGRRRALGQRVSGRSGEPRRGLRCAPAGLG